MNTTTALPVNPLIGRTFDGISRLAKALGIDRKKARLCQRLGMPLNLEAAKEWLLNNPTSREAFSSDIQDFADAIGIRRQYVSLFKRKGMPINSTQAAKEWLAGYRLRVAENRKRVGEKTRARFLGVKNSWKHKAAEMCGIAFSTVHGLASYKHAPKSPLCFFLWHKAWEQRKKDMHVAAVARAKLRSKTHKRSAEYLEKWKAIRNTDEYRAKQRERFRRTRKQISAREKERRRTDPNFRLKLAMKRRLSKTLKLSSVMKGGKKTTEMLGCGIPFLRHYLEEQFNRVMSWGNYGTYWHVDHIEPLSKFDFKNPEHLKRAFHYRNLRPLIAVDNLKKSHRVITCQPELAIPA